LAITLQRSCPTPLLQHLSGCACTKAESAVLARS